MWGVSIDYIVQWVSPELAHFVGLEVDDFLGRDFREFVFPCCLPTVEEGVENQSTATFWQRVRTPTGPQEVEVTPIWANYHGKKARFVHMVRTDVPAEM